MKAITIFCLLGLLVSYAIAQTFSATNKIDRVQAAKIASRLKVGMREEDAEKVLAQSGITNGAFKVGCSHGWTSAFILSDGCSLALDIAPKQARTDGAWAGGLLRAADIQSNGVKIVSITLTNAP
jgi:hypothetical protein